MIEGMTAEYAESAQQNALDQQDPFKEEINFTKDLSGTDAIPSAAIERVRELMESGRIHRYGEASGDQLEVVEIEREYASYMGLDYAVALNSCGCALFVALKCVGVTHGDLVLTNSFTLAPVPGAIAHAGATPVLVEITEDLFIDLDDLRAKALASGAKVLLLSHMRGHIVDMDALMAICNELDIAVVEDCAHTMGAAWDGKLSGTFGKVACFSTQTFKHINSGEGGLLVTNDEDIAAQAILYSGSYMLYAQHGARPDLAVFERWKAQIPNFSMRMSNVAAAMLRAQLPLLEERAQEWNARYAKLAHRFGQIPHIVLPKRTAKEQYVASSIQFLVSGLEPKQLDDFQRRCDDRGVHLKWFGRDGAVGFTSTYRHWEYMESSADLPQSSSILAGLFDMRIPLSLTDEDIEVISRILDRSMREVIA